MKAFICNKYGSPEVLKIKELAKPVPNNNEVLVKVKASSVTLFDCWMRSCTAPPGFGFLMKLALGKKPKKQILGTELSGEIESVGRDVTQFKPGDQIFSYLGMKLGAYTEYICLPEDSVIAKKPENLSFEEAGSSLQSTLTALYFLRKANIQEGQKILIIGASGGVGSAAIQLAKHFGAIVSGVCSTSKIDFVKSLGIKEVYDYTKEDYTKHNEKYDIILDTMGKSSVFKCKKILKNTGFYLMTTFGIPKFISLIFMKITSNRRFFIGTLEETIEQLNYIKDLLEKEAIKPTVDKVFLMDQISAAHHYVESGNKKGHVVVQICKD